MGRKRKTFVGVLLDVLGDGITTCGCERRGGHKSWQLAISCAQSKVGSTIGARAAGYKELGYGK